MKNLFLILFSFISFNLFSQTDTSIVEYDPFGMTYNVEVYNEVGEVSRLNFTDELSYQIYLHEKEVAKEIKKGRSQAQVRQKKKIKKMGNPNNKFINSEESWVSPTNPNWLFVKTTEGEYMLFKKNKEGKFIHKKRNEKFEIE